MSFKNKTAFITGSSRGIGRAIALKLAKEGYDIILHYRKNADEAKTLECEISGLGRKVVSYAADLSNLEEVEVLIQALLKNHLQIDCFVANAAATAFKPLEEIKAHHIAKTFNITVTTFILITNALKPRMSQGSKVITVSGIDTKKYCVNHGLLAAAKASLEMLTRYYATEWAADKIYFHGINPGIVDTDSMKVYLGDSHQEATRQMAEMIPEGRLMPTEDVAEMVSFLLSPTANWMNGETLYADGGLGFQMPVLSKSIRS